MDLKRNFKLKIFFCICQDLNVDIADHLERYHLLSSTRTFTEIGFRVEIFSPINFNKTRSAISAVLNTAKKFRRGNQFQSNLNYVHAFCLLL
ncbi:hypothetical protein OUZ56_017720 [Daphnia magna]|uniref:Uncharacterized protein n=1 Tax=Daphnia magna TaxID=35525 RepID=A0ABR0ATK0_9CRUS|nr:hypothetical protein OUZ56_017720 [Daphnia magna]